MVWGWARPEEVPHEPLEPTCPVQPNLTSCGEPERKARAQIFATNSASGATWLSRRRQKFRSVQRNRRADGYTCHEEVLFIINDAYIRAAFTGMNRRVLRLESDFND